jgi:chromosome segregation ATPase
MRRLILIACVLLAVVYSASARSAMSLERVPEAEEAPIHTFEEPTAFNEEMPLEENHAMIESGAPTVNGPTTRNNGPTRAKDRKPDKLEIALQAVKEEIMVRARELHNEKDWVKRVEGLVSEYNQKLKKVTSNIDKLRLQTKELLKKKKQIQNAQIQAKLRDRLQTAHADMQRLQKQMAHIKSKEDEFSETEKRLKDTMNALKGSLLKLRGQTEKKKN